MNSNFSNLTSGGLDDSRSSVVTVVYITMGLLGVFGNGLVLLVIVVVQDLHDVANILIGNQSLIDLLTSLLLLGSFVAPLPAMPDNPTLARFLCAFWNSKFPFWSLTVASSLNLTLMTLERYWAIVFPIDYRARTRSAKFNCLVVLPWLIGAIYQHNLMWFTRVEQNRCILFEFPNDATRTGLAFGALFLELLLPFAVMVFVYISISIKLKGTVEERFNRTTKKERESTSCDSTSHKPNMIDHRSRARRNVIKMMLIVSACFIICWTPNQILYMSFCFGFELDFDGLLYTLSVFIAFGNMWINPFIYSFQYRRFQKGLKKVFCQ